MKHQLLILFFVILSPVVHSQYKQLSPDSKISVLTIGPGTSLNDSFGHSAYRVKDSLMDIVFNYGVYDFDTPNFYTKFAQGKLNYKIGANYFEDFERSYIDQNRTIKEQVLNLTLNEKQKVFNYLSRNYEPANQYYLYDFFYDNCATKIRDVLIITLKDKIMFYKPKSFQSKTFRTLIQQNLNWNSWGSLGIDVALGSVIDKKAAPTEYMFLPEYIHDFFGSAVIQSHPNKKLVENEKIIYLKTNTKSSSNFFLSPLFVLGIVSLIIIYITFKDRRQNKRRKWLDVFLFTTTGIIGVVILLLWFATDHKATAQNYNLLWAFAINLFMIFQALKIRPSRWFKRYLKFLVIMMCLLTLHWIIGIQRFAFGLIPILIALTLRYLYLINYYQKQVAI